MRTMHQLNEIFPEWFGGNKGVISLLESNNVVPWNTTTTQIGSKLDLEYHGNRSGQKIISPLLRQMLNGQGELSTESANRIAGMIGALFGESWSREWAVLESVYEPIENYSMIEEMDDDETVIDYGKVLTNSGKLTHTKTGTESTSINHNETETPNVTVKNTPATTETITHNTTVTETPATTETVTHNTTVTETPATTETVTHNTTVTETPNTHRITETSNYGFDTPDNTPVKTERVDESYNTGSTNATATTGTDATAKTGNDTTKTTGTESTSKTGTDTTQTTGTEATAKTGTDTTTTTGSTQTAMIGSDSITHNVTDEDTDTRKVTESGSDTHTRNYTLTRKGNIGITTSQQMLQSEIDLWMWNFFRNVMFPDIDSVLTLAIY